MRRLLIVLIILVVLAVGADVGARLLAQSWVSKELATSLHLSEQPNVSLGGFPFIPHLLGGTFPSVAANAGGLTAEGVSFQKVTLSLRDVTFSLVELAAGRKTTIRAASGTGTAAITGAELTSALRAHGVSVTVRMDGDRVFVRSDQLGQEVGGTVAVDGQTLTVRPTGAPGAFSFSVKLPQVIPNLEYRRVTIEGSTAVLSFGLEHPTFQT